MIPGQRGGRRMPTTSRPSLSSTWTGALPTRVTSTTAGPSAPTTLTRPATSLTLEPGDRLVERDPLGRVERPGVHGCLRCVALSITRYIAMPSGPTRVPEPVARRPPSAPRSQVAPGGGGARVQRGRGRHGDPQRRRGQHPAHRGVQALVADERGARLRVAQRDRHDPGARVDGRLEHRRPERTHRGAAPGRALREDRHGRAAAQGGRDLGDGRREGARPGAVHEDRAGGGGHRADHRPAAHLALGEQPARRHRQDRERVEPGDVVGDQQRPVARDPAARAQAYADRPEHGAGPERRRPPGERQRHGGAQQDGDQGEEPPRLPVRGQRPAGRGQAARAAVVARPPDRAHGRSRRKCRR